MYGFWRHKALCALHDARAGKRQKYWHGSGPVIRLSHAVCALVLLRARLAQRLTRARVVLVPDSDNASVWYNADVLYNIRTLW